MKLTLDIDASTTFAGDLKDLLHSLSDEQKARIAEQLVVQVLSESESRLNVARGVERALSEMNEKRSSNDRLYWSPHQGLHRAGSYSYISAQDDRQFKELVRQHADIADYFNHVVFGQIAKLASQEVEEKIKDSERVRELVQQAVAVAEKHLPQIVTSALTSVLVSSIRSGLDRVENLNDNHNTLQSTVDEMKSRLLPGEG